MDSEHKNELSALVRYKAKMIKWGIIAVVLIAAFLAIFFKGYSTAAQKSENEIDSLIEENKKLKDDLANAAHIFDNTVSKEVSLSLIEAEIKGIGELATIEYLYTDAGKFEDPQKVFGVNIPFTKKSFVAKWDGIIKAGVTIDKIIVEIKDASKEIIIHMPDAEILSHEIDSTSFETLDEKDGLFNPVKVQDVRQFDAVSKEAMERRAIENGILDKALENAKEIIEKLVNNDVVQEQGYTVKFETLKK
ncbi:MAG: DUF4230 domain-containing protein [Ruminococcaceae bacterium]|nr:DUF4230 domain-containing protein [Oscillospiraceae bacterium]